jgi:hypothetical protein
MLETDRPEAVSPDRALRLPTFNHFLMVNNLFSLAHSLRISNQHAMPRSPLRTQVGPVFFVCVRVCVCVPVCVCAFLSLRVCVCARVYVFT